MQQDQWWLQKLEEIDLCMLKKDRNVDCLLESLGPGEDKAEQPLFPPLTFPVSSKSQENANT